MNLRQILTYSCFFLIALSSKSQSVNGKLRFNQGQILQVDLQMKNTITQQAMGNAIDFTVQGSLQHRYSVTNSTDDNTTLRHSIQRIGFQVEGMGPKRGFDSGNPKDMEGMFGPRVKELMAISYDMIVDTAGKVLMVRPEKIELSNGDERLAIVFNLLKDVTSAVFPPGRNESSLFKILPDTTVHVQSAWSESIINADGRFTNNYQVTAITDSTIVVELKGSSQTATRAAMMGMQITTRMNNSYTGVIIMDRLTGLAREKTIKTHSTGTTDGMGGTTPVSSDNEIKWIVTALPG